MPHQGAPTPPPPPFSDAARLLDELIAGYSAPDFQRRLADIYRQHVGNSDEDQVQVIRKRRELCMLVQRSVLPRYGFEATQAGVRKCYRTYQTREAVQDVELNKRTSRVGELLDVLPRVRALELSRHEEHVLRRWTDLISKVVSTIGVSIDCHGRKAAAFYEVTEDGIPGRQRVLEKLATDGCALELADERYRNDPDVVLAAVAHYAGAFEYASQDLRLQRNFVIEAVYRNWKALEFVPELLRADRTVMLAAVRQDRMALRYGPSAFGDDSCFESEVNAEDTFAGALAYNGRSMRLVGYCNNWRTTDNLMRFKCVDEFDMRPHVEAYSLQIKYQGWGLDGKGGNFILGLTPPAQYVLRHELPVYLREGCLSFQAASCTRPHDFRVYPSGIGDDGFCRLQRGSRSSIASAVGSTEDAGDNNYYVEEAAGTSIVIHVDLEIVASACRGLAVWYDVIGKGDAGRFWKTVCLSQARDRQLPKFKLERESVSGAKIIADVDHKGEYHKLVMQLLGLSDQKSELQFDLRAIIGSKHMTLIVCEAECIAYGYCIYAVLRDEGFLWIETLLVLEAHRHRGYGRTLVRWVTAQARLTGCFAVRLKSNANAELFYKALGFHVIGGTAEAPMLQRRVV